MKQNENETPQLLGQEKPHPPQRLGQMSIPAPGWPLCLHVEGRSASPGMDATCGRPASKEDGSMGSQTVKNKRTEEYTQKRRKPPKCY